MGMSVGKWVRALVLLLLLAIAFDAIGISVEAKKAATVRALNPNRPFCKGRVYGNCLPQPPVRGPPCRYNYTCRRPPAGNGGGHGSATGIGDAGAAGKP